MNLNVSPVKNVFVPHVARRAFLVTDIKTSSGTEVLTQSCAANCQTKNQIDVIVSTNASMFRVIFKPVFKLKQNNSFLVADRI